MTTNYEQQAADLAREIIELNPEMTREELTETYHERIHEIADNSVIYYSYASEIVEHAWGTDINVAEEYLADVCGEDIYSNCASYGDVQCRLAYALVYVGLQDESEDAIGAAWEWRHTYTYTINLDERGEFSATVWDYSEVGEVFTIDSAEHLDSLIQDGDMQDAHDIDGLLNYLQEREMVSDCAQLVA